MSHHPWIGYRQPSASHPIRQSREALFRRVAPHQIAELEKQRAEAETMIRELQHASDKAWEDMKSGFETAWNNVSNAFQSASSRFN